MASPIQIQFLSAMKTAATAANHPHPGAAAAEAAVETGWGVHVPLKSFNVLGIKAYRGYIGPTVGASGTEENKDGTMTGPQADQWCVFPSYQACFAEQVKILQEPRYAAAMADTSIDRYIDDEARVWSTSSSKGVLVDEIYHAHEDILA